MSFWVLVQIFFNLVILAAIGFIWVRLSKPAKDDPRLSRGLQLLQSKISVLEDLSDRTEIQVSQLNTLMEQKCRDIQGYVVQADKQIQKIESAMGKSLEVAKIFQDKIPHQEIIERQNTIKYVKAARMAHQGSSVEEIAQAVDLSHGEIEFIAKVNRDQLQFSEEDLPAWAKEEAVAQEVQSVSDLMHPLVHKPAAAPKSSENSGADPQVHSTLSQLGDQFRQAFSASSQVPQSLIESAPAMSAPAIQRPPGSPQPKFQKPDHQLRDSDAGVVKKVVFPRIEGNNNLG